jgi:hypothetical protein
MQIVGIDKLNDINFIEKKTFIMGSCGSGKTAILAKILGGVNSNLKTLFIGNEEVMRYYYNENNNQDMLIDKFSDKAIINLGNYTTRRISEDYEVEKKEVIPEKIDAQFVVHDELYKRSESINNLFLPINKGVGYVAEVHVGQDSLLGLAESHLQEAVIFIDKQLTVNGLDFVDVPELMLILTLSSYDYENNVSAHVSVYDARQLGVIVAELKNEKPQLFKEISFNKRAKLIDSANGRQFESIKSLKFNSIMSEIMDLVEKHQYQIGLPHTYILEITKRFLNKDPIEILVEAEGELTKLKQMIYDYKLANPTGSLKDYKSWV